MGGLGAIHGLGAVGLIFVVWRPSVPTLVLAGVLYVLSGLSITAGYHRLFAHRSYRASAPVRWFFLAFGAATFQNSALAWSADHRAHHADTDGPDDPHAITNGIWWAHAGWLLQPRTASADVTRLSDLWAIRSVRLQRRFYPIIAIALGLGAAHRHRPHSAPERFCLDVCHQASNAEAEHLSRRPSPSLNKEAHPTASRL